MTDQLTSAARWTGYEDHQGNRRVSARGYEGGLLDTGEPEPLSRVCAAIDSLCALLSALGNSSRYTVWNPPKNRPDPRLAFLIEHPTTAERVREIQERTRAEVDARIRERVPRPHYCPGLICRCRR